MKASAEEIKSLIDYNPVSGIFTWKENRKGKKKSGDTAGCASSEGYVTITVCMERFKGGDLAWLCMTGCFPPKSSVVAHKDGDRLNCIWENIEIAQKSPSYETKDMISYDPETGLFSWRYRFSPIGKPLEGRPGWVAANGYIRISTNGREIQAHRLAHIFMTGVDVPKGMDIDHINGIESDNRWCNLRVVTRTQNLMNSITRADNKSGVKGVYWDPRRELWQAEIKVMGKKEHLGRFKTIEEAAAARESAEKRLFGEYSYRESRGTTNEINQ